MNENFPEATAVPFKNATDCFAALQSNQAVALVTNRSVAAQLTASSFDNEQVIKLISPERSTPSRSTRRTPTLRMRSNDTIAKFTEDGTTDALMEKYNIE